MSDEPPSLEPVPVPDEPFEWHRVSTPTAFDGRVTTVTVGRRSLAVSNSEGRYGAIDNHCPPQRGPLGRSATTTDHRRVRRRRVRSVREEITDRGEVRMNITHVIMNNSELGKISKEQRAAELDVWQTGVHNPSFGEFASCAARGGRGSVESISSTLRSAAACAHDGPAIVEVITDALLDLRPTPVCVMIRPPRGG